MCTHHISTLFFVTIQGWRSHGRWCYGNARYGRRTQKENKTLLTQFRAGATDGVAGSMGMPCILTNKKKKAKKKPTSRTTLITIKQKKYTMYILPGTTINNVCGCSHHIHYMQNNNFTSYMTHIYTFVVFNFKMLLMQQQPTYLLLYTIYNYIKKILLLLLYILLFFFSELYIQNIK